MNTIAAFTIALSIYGSGQPPVIIQFKTLALCFEGVMTLSKDYPEAVCREASPKSGEAGRRSRGPDGLAIKSSRSEVHTPDAPKGK